MDNFSSELNAKNLYWEQINQFADECAGEISPEILDHIKLHLSYDYHHFGYGMYLRSKYVPRMDKSVFFIADVLSFHIYYCLLAKLFPNLGNDLNKISSVTDSKHFTEVCAHYYLRRKDMPFGEFPISSCSYIPLTDVSPEELINHHDKNIENFKKYSLAIAEALWNYKSFKTAAAANGVNTAAADAFYDVCKSLFTERAVFIPMELVYYSLSSAIPSDIKEHIIAHMSYFFETHTSYSNYLPDYILKNADFLKLFHLT